MGLPNEDDFVVLRYNNSIILPVTILSFTSQKQNNTTELKWQTANEINTAYFNIQRSSDGRSFANIDKVEARAGKVKNDYFYVMIYHE